VWREVVELSVDDTVCVVFWHPLMLMPQTSISIRLNIRPGPGNAIFT
jgi:hypothetical protein